MEKTYSYTAICGNFFCLQSSIVNLGWILLIKYTPAQLSSLGIKRQQVPGILKSLVKYRFFKHPNTANITLPVAGHLCIKVHHGHKVFNLSKLTATKVFNAAIDVTDAHNEIQAITEAGSLDFAPTVLAIEPDNRWYTEVFIPGSRSKRNDRSKPEALYAATIAQHLQKMLLLRPVQTTTVKQHVRNLHIALNGQLDSQLADKQLDNTLYNEISTFIEIIFTRLESAKDNTIGLAYTHGDFSFVNFITQDEKTWVIDWETAKERSLLHDLFNYFFTEIYYQRTQNVLDDCLDKAIDRLLQEPGMNKITGFPKTNDQKTVYRWLYYLERMIMLLNREASAIRTRVIQRTIDLFTANQKEQP